MSDSQINKIIQYGTTAERIAFTPDPPLVAGNPAQTLYIWYDTDNAPNTYVWDGAAWDQINAVGEAAISQLTGDVTAGPGVGSQAATIAANAVTNTKLADMAAATIKGSIAGGDPADLTATQTTALLNNFVGDSGSGGTKGLVPAPAAGDAAADKFLHADGTWKVASAPILRAITISVNDAAMSVGVIGEQTYVYNAGTIIAWYILADASGDIEFDVLKTSFASYPASFASIVAAAPPELVATDKDSDTTLTGWTTAVAQFDVIRAELMTIDPNITRLNLTLVIQEN